MPLLPGAVRLHLQAPETQAPFYPLHLLGKEVTCLMGGGRLGGTGEEEAAGARRVSCPSNPSRGRDPVFLSMGEGHRGLGTHRTTLGSGLEVAGMVGLVAIWGPNWGLGKRAGSWGVLHPGSWAEAEAQGLELGFGRWAWGLGLGWAG